MLHLYSYIAPIHNRLPHLHCKVQYEYVLYPVPWIFLSVVFQFKKRLVLRSVDIASAGHLLLKIFRPDFIYIQCVGGFVETFKLHVCGGKVPFKLNVCGSKVSANNMPRYS